MLRQPVQLPAEVWSHVFRHLSVTDKSSVRASCRYFKKLIDHASLWKDWTVVLSFPNGPYNSQFWVTLRRRKVSSAVVRSGRAKNWTQLALALPALSTVIMEQSSRETINYLKHFNNLRRLSVRRSCSSLIRDAFRVRQPEQLTHLSLCDVNMFKTSLDSFISAVSKFSGLTSLVCHRLAVFEEPVWMIHSILACLPELKHLSLSVQCSLYPLHSNPRPNPVPLQTAPLLSSLELIDYMDQSLPEDTMKLMPGLKRLAVFHRHSHHEAAGICPPVCHLTTWLSDLPHLSTLVVVKGPPVTEYIRCIPATATSLTVCVAGISSEEMAAVAVKVPNLLHLHIDPWPSHLGTHTAQIPRLFPKLKSLKLRHEHVPQRDFLHLHQLQDLEYLQILDDRPQVSELTGKLQALTDYKLQITTCPRQRDVMSCPCVSQVY